MSERQKLLEAKKDIEQKSGIKFRPESIALADLISEFVAVKLAEKIIAGKPEQPVLGSPASKPSDDFLYGS